MKAHLGYLLLVLRQLTHYHIFQVMSSQRYPQYPQHPQPGQNYPPQGGYQKQGGFPPQQVGVGPPGERGYVAPPQGSPTVGGMASQVQQMNLGPPGTLLNNLTHCNALLTSE